MFAVLLLPFADLRPFVGHQAGRLQRPTWPLASPGRDYVRSSGVVEARRRRGLEEWSGEDLYGKAHRALRFSDRLGSKMIGGDGVALKARCVFRRFYCDGVVARLEVGLRLTSRKQSPGTLSGAQLLAISRDILSIRAGSTDSKEPRTRLVKCGSEMAEHYLRCTTKRTDGKWPSLEKWWFVAGEPLLLMELEPQSAMGMPPHSRVVGGDLIPGLRLAHCRVEQSSQQVGIWFLTPEPSTDANSLRRLRIHLMRLHAERESLRAVLIQIIRKNLAFGLGEETSDEIQSYLNRAVTLLERDSRFGIAQYPLLEAAKHWTDILDQGRKATLTAELQKARRNVQLKVQRFAERRLEGARVVNVFRDSPAAQVTVLSVEALAMKKIHFAGDVTVTGDFNAVVADSIQASFNKATDSSVPADRKQQLQELAQHVAEMAKSLDEARAEQAARDLENLTAEALSKEPRRRWWELSAEGLIEAAKAVGEAAAPVVSTVKTLMTLLG